MTVTTPAVLDADDLNDTDRALLDLLTEGRVTPKFVADEIGISREYASTRLRRLTEHDHVEKLATGLYELADDPRGGRDPSER